MTGVTDLDRIRGPRDAAVVRLLSRRVEPAFGFIVYGVVYLFLSSFAGLASALVGGLLSAGLGFGKGSTVQDVIDRAGVTEKVKVCESYPAAAWRKWFTTGNPANVSHEELQGHLGAILRPDNGRWTMTPHERDALICACVARARAAGRTLPIPSNLLDRARREGWIHLQQDDVMIANLSEH